MDGFIVQVVIAHFLDQLNELIMRPSGRRVLNDNIYSVIKFVVMGV